MGNRTLSPGLVLRALFLDSEAYAELRDDDNPFIEGLFLLVIIGVLTALLAMIGQLLAWASTPNLAAIKDVVFRNLQQMPWWSMSSGAPGFAEEFRRWYDLGWQVIPAMSGAPNPAGAAVNILLWPLSMLVSWLIYGVLAHLFARMLGGHGPAGPDPGPHRAGLHADAAAGPGVHPVPGDRECDRHLATAPAVQGGAHGSRPDVGPGVLGDDAAVRRLSPLLADPGGKRGGRGRTDCGEVSDGRMD